MIEVASRDAKTGDVGRIGAQPIALAAAALVVLLLGASGIGLWRAYTGTSPEADRVVAARQMQAKTAETSERLAEKTKDLEVTQQESIDQLQVVQDQLQTVKRLLATQQADTKRLSEQVAALTEAVDGLRQSFASSPPQESSGSAPVRNKSIRTRLHAITNVHRKLVKSHG